MAYFEVRQRFVDYVNHYEFLRGEFIETECFKWVQRMGSTLQEVRMLPDRVKPIPVNNTVEDVVADIPKEAQVELESSKEEEAPLKVTARTRAVRKAPMDKVVTEDDSAAK